MLCVKCEQKPIRYKGNSLCWGCDRREKSLERLDDMTVTQCLGGCGKRIHNMPMIVVPGVPQGHGPGRVWCGACASAREPGTPQPKGNCKKCKSPMVTRRAIEGFKVHRAKGLCDHCYMTSKSKTDNTKGENNGNSKLVAAHVIDIRNRVAKGQAKREVARMYGINAATVRHIVNRDTWTHV